MTRFERGVQLYEGENYEGALVEFTTAYELSKNYKLLYNIAICQTALKDYVVATETFQRYLADGGAEIPEARKADVNERLAKLALNVAHVTVTTDAPPGTTLMIDDQPVATTPLPESIAVKIGRRQFSIVVNGRRAAQTVSIASGNENAPIHLTVAETVPPPVEAPQQSAPPQAASPSFPYLWWGMTGALGVASAVVGTFAVGKRNDFEERQATFGVSRKSLEDAQSSAQTLGVVTDVLLVATVAAAGVSTWFTIDYVKKKKRSTGLVVTPFGVGYTRSF
ncbi:MAG: hypothetical protein KIT84_05185 [Labilithrix sp.]|nr:hypothetical protein [Labilithrix sp.]MCW5810380.1 hypothetical protein [Labilithrix sp.]